jgi:hypothetical protein
MSLTDLFIIGAAAGFSLTITGGYVLVWWLRRKV